MQNKEDQDDSELSGAEFLGELIDTISGGSLPSIRLTQQIHSFLNNVQAKIDLTQIGLVKYHMSRAKKLSKLVNMIEDTLIDPEADRVVLSEEERVELLKHYSKELQVSIEFITSKANKPTISSPEGMKNAAGEDTTARKNFTSELSPEQRQRIRNLALTLKNTLTLRIDKE